MFDATEYQTAKDKFHGLVRDWMTAFGVEPNLELQESLVLEEAREVLDVFKDHPEPSVEGLEELLKEAADLAFVLVGYNLMSQDLGEDRQFGPETALCVLIATEILRDLVFLDPVTNDAILGEAFERVVASNMSKLDDNGEVIRNEAGKVMKGPNYAAPDLRDLAERFFATIN